MAEGTPNYKKLPGRASGLIIGATRLWYGDDHLICVSSVFGSERYQRVYFREVEAFVVRATKGRLAWNTFFGVILLGLVLLTLLVGSSESWAGFGTDETRRIMMIILAVPAALALIAFIINTLKGQTCAFSIQTSVGMTHLGAPVRVRDVHKVREILAPMIVQAQSAPLESVPRVP